jgi:hypothetical protein
MSVSALSTGAYTTTCLMMVILSPQLLLYPSKVFRHGNNSTLSLVRVYSELFNNVFEALNLFFNNYVPVAEIQLPGNAIWLLSIPQSSSQSSDTC